jgi:uncharacterized protein (TIGR01777 family)
MKILITGGTGLIGNRLTEILLQKGHEVAYLSRSGKIQDGIRHYQWDIKNNFMEKEALSFPEVIINLAGANVFEKKWTKEFKKEILESRTESVNLLYKEMKEGKLNIKAFISASAIGYYGADTKDKWITENNASGKDFLAEVVSKWEDAMDQFALSGLRTVKLRIGVVLSKKGGALEKLLTPIKMGVGAIIGSGNQYVSWIHIDDLCNLFVKAVEDPSMNGIYNAVAPEPVSNEKLTKDIAAAIGKSIHLPNVPAFALKMMLGSEKASIILGGNRISAEKIIKEGFQFQFPDLKSAISDLLL